MKWTWFIFFLEEREDSRVFKLFSIFFLFEFIEKTEREILFLLSIMRNI